MRDKTAGRRADLRSSFRCDQWVEDAEVLRTIHGLGTLDSALKLQEGFANKAAGAKDVIGQMATAAKSMADGYLQAAGLLAEADQLNSDAIRGINGQA